MKLFDRAKLPLHISSAIGQIEGFLKGGGPGMPTAYIATNGDLVVEYVDQMDETEEAWNALLKTIPEGIAGDPKN